MIIDVGLARQFLDSKLRGKDGYITIEIAADPRTQASYLRVFVTTLTEELFDILPDCLFGHTVVVEQVGVGRRIA